MQIIHLFPESFGSNCYILEDSGQAWIVDPSAAAASILKRIRDDGCTPEGIALTHGHFDHILSVDTLRQACPSLKVWIHEADAPLLPDGEKNAFRLFFGQDRSFGEADCLLKDGDTLTVGSSRLTVLHTPGHTPGSVCFVDEADGFILTGDTLFAEGYGRCDLYGGDISAMRTSLSRLETLDGHLTIYPGHGGTETLSRALRNARYL